MRQRIRTPAPCRPCTERAVEELARRVAEQDALLRVARRVAAGAPAGEVADLVAREVALLLDVEAGIVWRFEAGESVVVGAHGDHRSAPGVAFPLAGEGALVAVARTGRAARVRYGDMPHGDPTAARVVTQGFVSGIAAPIVVDERPWGAVLAATTTDREPAPDAEERLGRFAELVSLAIAAAESREELARRATRDDLTGVANRGEFHRRLASELSRASRHGRPLSLVLVDIDHFKRVNDAAGHQVGDRVLRAVVATIVRGLRAEDVPARVGGEEFAVVLPETSAATAVVVAERVRRAVAALREPGLPAVTISAGVADLGDARDPDGLVAAADAALYAAKRGGRDRVERYDPAAPAPGDTGASISATGTPEVEALRALARAVAARCRRRPAARTTA